MNSSTSESMEQKADTKSLIADAIVKEAQKHIGVMERDGNNRSFMIDRYNKNVGAPLGSPYCLAGIWWILDQAGNSLGVKFDLPKTAGTQFFWGHVKPEYKLTRPEKGAIAIFQQMGEPTRGHAALVTAIDWRTDNFDTIEFNTNEAGSRDGQGVYWKKRSLISNTPLKLLGFVSPMMAAQYKGLK